MSPRCHQRRELRSWRRTNLQGNRKCRDPMKKSWRAVNKHLSNEDSHFDHFTSELWNQFIHMRIFISWKEICLVFESMLLQS
jgi:hypothetical protein